MSNASPQKYDGLALFSGGLDSILSIKLLEEQGLKIKALHFISPFFGSRAKVPFWERTYGLDILPVDISGEYAAMLVNRPAHGVGSVLNPCVDCKIVMLKNAAGLMEDYGAAFLVSGEVLGQRPMSQRRDTLNVIRRDAGVKDLLLRPLCAKCLEPTPAELSGLVDRERLLGISGRGRKDQLALAARYGITQIPTPAGGCLLTERENARSFWPVIKYGRGRAEDFRLAGTGRQYWSFYGDKGHWLCIGRNKDDNAALQALAGENDLSFKVKDFPGPLAVARQFEDWTPEAVASAASFIASFSGKATKAGESGPVTVRVHHGPQGLDGPGYEVEVRPERNPAIGWSEYAWESAREEIRDYYNRN